ncbi:MAG: serine/threonine protein kinase [Polyangiaceae bacterium]|nr:serine/threonine protein kinase [Polyangiaceae bacterium]
MDADRTAVAGTLASDDGTALAPGTMVGEYRVDAALGEGGFGSVYRATHPIIGKTAAIKLLKHELSSNGEMVSRFIAEARAVNQIRHRNIIDIFAFGVHSDGRQYYVMEYLEGSSLEGHLEAHGGRLPVPDALAIFRPLARALHAAHVRGVAHRDIKPENVLLTTGDDGELIPKLLDFGIAKLAADPASKFRTAPGVQMGTPAYMAPEQVHGRPSDQRADIYTFGVMVFEVLTGRLPFEAETAMAVMVKHATEAPPSMSELAPDLPAALDAPVLRMMQKDPDARPTSILEALDELVAAAEQAGLVSAERFPRLAGGEGAMSVAGRTVIGPPSSSSVIPSSSARSARSSSGGGALDARRDKPSGLGTLKIAAAVLAAGLAVVAIVSLARTKPSPEPSVVAPTTPAASEPSGMTSGVVVTPSVAPMAAEARASASAAVEPATVKLAIASTPPDAEVFLGDQRLGKSGEKLSLPRGSEPLTLTVKRAGFVPKQLEITPNDDVAETVVLQAAAKPKEYAW